MNEQPFLLENNILEIDYCIPHKYGLMIQMSGQLFKGKPFGDWKKFDEIGNIKEIFKGESLSIYRTENSKIEGDK